MFKLIQKWGQRMATKLMPKGGRTPRVLPSIELIPVKEDEIDAQLRRLEVKELLAKLYALSHTRGRPKKRPDESETYAA